MNEKEQQNNIDYSDYTEYSKQLAIMDMADQQDYSNIDSTFAHYTKHETKPDEEINAKYYNAKDLLTKSLEELEATKASDFVSYGYNFLDNHLGGIYKSDLIVIGGETGSGKTVFSNNIAIKASKNHKVAIWSLEDNPVSILKQKIYTKIGELRIKDGLTQYPFIAYWKNEIKDINFASYKKRAFEAVQNDISDNLLYVDPQQTATIDLLEREIIKQSKAGVELMLVDHLHKFQFDKAASLSSSIESFMNRLRKVQEKTGMRILLIVHYAKLGGKKPILDSFKDSISIPQNASVVINL